MQYNHSVERQVAECEMTGIRSSLATTVAQRLRVLAQLYEQGQASELMDRTLD